MKKIVCLLLVIFMLIPLFAACGNEGKEDSIKNDTYGSGDSPSGDAYFEAPSEGGDYAGDMAEDGAVSEGDEPIDGDTNGNNRTPAAGMITAGAQNDNVYYEDWKNLFGQESKYREFDWYFNTLNRVTVTVKKDGAAVPGAKVTLEDANGMDVYSAVTDANGIAYLFGQGNETTVCCAGVLAQLQDGEQEITLNVSSAKEKKNKIELMFVVDVTGSMGDELRFLKKELEDVINRVAKDNANVQIDLALLFYRDHTDAEVFDFYEFVNVNSADALQSMLKKLENQKADGGGDYPEAVDEALKMAVEADWSDDATTKILFHVLDAPPHSDKQNKDVYYEAVMTAAEKGIRICPVLCSGAALLTEYLTREAAICTAGTFVFVTNDSGIGGSHHDPGLPNVTVEYLNSLMIRLINGYHTGKFADPVSWKEE